MDEFPVGGGSGGGMGGVPAAEEDFSKMPLEDRLASKAWKARVSAYEELVRQFEKSPSDSAPVFRPYTRNPDAVKAMVTDSNAVAQEKAVDAVRTFLQYGGKAAGSTRETVLPSIVEKCFGAMRAGTKKTALEIVSLYVEMEDVMGSEGSVLALVQGTAAKQPKVVAGSVSALTQLVRDFGPKQVAFKPILKRLPDIFGHSDKTVRTEAALLAQELHKWIGAALEPTLAALKDIQAKELRELFAKSDQAGEKLTSPTRYLISQRPTAVEEGVQADDVETNGQVAGESKEKAEELDTFEFLEPKDPFKSKDWPENLDEMLRSTKWLERKEVLDQCIKVLELTPRIIHTPAVDSLMDVLSEKIKKDANINVALSACVVIQRFAQGLRAAFAKNKDVAMPALLEKLKERKESTVKVLADTLDAVFLTVTLTDVLELTLNATKHKNPQVKTGAIQFLARCLKETRIMPSKADVKPTAEALVSATTDGSADVREAGAQGLGTLMKLIGERAMIQYIDGLDDIKKAKIQEEFRKATVKVKQGGGAAPAKAAAPATAAPKPRTVAIKAAPPAVVARTFAKSAAAEKENVPPPRAAVAPVSRGPPPTARAVAAIKPAAARPAGASAPRPAGGGGKAAASATDPVKYRFHPEEAEARASDLVPSHIQEELSTSVWKDRLAAMAKFNDWLKLECDTVESELVVRFLSRKPGWKESNFQVMGEMYSALRMLASDCPTFGRPAVAISITPLCEKLGDIKLKGPAGETLLLYAEKTSIGFVLAQALAPLGNLKAPKAIADSLAWINQAIVDFGTANIDVRGLVEHLITCLKSANAGVRTNATAVIVTLSRFLGAALSTLLGDLNTQLRTTIEAEIEKASGDSAPAPTRFSDETRPKSSNNGAAAGAVEDAGPSQADEDALDALIPRVDLDGLLTPATVTQIGDANWKERKEGLEEVNAILDANARLKPKMGDIGTALKLRFADNNIQVRTLALDALAKIATGMGRGFEGFVRTFVAPVTQVLADAKAPMRAVAAKTLTAMAEQTGVAPMTAGFVSVLESKTANPTLRQDLFTWLGEWLEAHPPDKTVEMNGLALPAIVCLDDKLAAVRKAAQSVLPFIILRAGYKFVMEQTNGLKAASRNTVVPLIDAAKSQASSKAPPPPPPSTTVSGRLGNGSAATNAPSVARKAQAPVSATSAPSLYAQTPKAAVKAPSAVGRTLKAAPMAVRSADDDDGARSARPGVRKTGMSSTAAGPTSSSSSSTAVAREKVSPFVSSDAKFKAMREKREGGKSSAFWITSELTPRPDLVEVLRQQCEAHISAPLLDTMFSKDHNAERDFLSALTMLSDYFAHPEASMEEYNLESGEAVARAVANSDLVLKYVAVRLTDNNTSMAYKCVDVLEHLIALLRAQEYHMSDYEANAILPCIVAKFGDPKVTFRDRVRGDVLRKITYVYPPSKLLSRYMEDGLPSKNARVRTECLGELGHLFHKYGVQVCTPAKTLPVIAKQISDRDNGVRTAALMAIGEVYKMVGDDIWRLVGTLPLKDRNMLEERLKRTAGPTAAVTPAAFVSMAVAANAAAVAVPPSPHLGNAVRPTTTTTTVAPRSSLANLSGAAAGQPQSSRLAVPARLSRPAAPASGFGFPGATAGGVPRSRLPGPPASGIARTVLPRPAASVAAVPAAPQRQAANGNGGHSRAASVAGSSKTSASREELGEDDRDEPLDERRIVLTPLGQRRPGQSAGPPQHTEEDAAVEQAINEILSSDCDCSVMALKKVEQEIQSVAPALTRHADQLATAFGKQLHRAFTLNGRGGTNNERLKKHLLITGTSIFDNTRLWEDTVEQGQRTLGSYVTKPALVSLLTELLQQLIETKGATDEETQTHGRYLNIIVLRSFSSCNLNVLFGACLLMLTEATEDLEDLQKRGDDGILDKRVKFADLICKCIWKITRKLNVCLQDESIDAAVLLQDLERFLQAIPPNVWKQRATDGVPLGEMPLRTVKVIIAHVGSVFGEESLDLLEGMADPEHSHVYAQLLKVCDRGGSAHLTSEDALQDGGDGEASPQAQGAAPRARPASSPATHQLASPKSVRSLADNNSGEHKSIKGSSHDEAESDADAAVNAELRSIFDRIASKSESRAAIKDLYQFQRRYPQKEASIRRSLEQTGPIFQKFIKRALANHAAEEGELSPFDDVSTRRDSVLSSPAGLGPRSSMALERQSSGGAPYRNSSFMSPSTSRTNLAAAALGGVGPSTPLSPSHSAFPSHHRTPGSVPASPYGGALPSSPSSHRNSINEDRIAQLRAKFARSTSNQSEL